MKVTRTEISWLKPQTLEIVFTGEPSEFKLWKIAVIMLKYWFSSFWGGGKKRKGS